VNFLYAARIRLMRKARFLLALAGALALAACARHQSASYIIDPATGQPVPMMAQQPYAQSPYGQPQYSQAQYASSYAQQSSSSVDRGFFNGSGRTAAPQQAYAQQSQVLQYTPPQYAQPQPERYAQPRYSAPQYAQPQYTAPSGQGGPYAAAPYAYASAPVEQPYTLDAGGNISLPLIGMVPARGYTTQQLTQSIAERLKQGFVREPHVNVEVEAYRPFFILSEVTTPGQYPYVANMTAETAIAIAGGFAPRADKKAVKLSRNTPWQQFSADVPLNTPLRPGDTIVVKERWF
jgi:protein involved in polysaccharide export with SLBB domain